jgi:competence protein ComEA
MNKLEKKELKFLIFILAVLLSIFFYNNKNLDFEILKSQINDNQLTSDDFKDVDVNEKTIWVDIDGAVNKPGVYEIDEDSRLFELIEIAGGLRKDAYTKDLNKSIKLSDEDKIYIKSLDEIDLEKESSKININTATREELMNLNGIGEAISGNIIIYRESKKFIKIEDIMKVKGIGESKFNIIKDSIKVN